MDDRENLPPRNPGQYKFKGIWIPKDVWLSRQLSWLEKCFVGELEFLDDDVRGCFATNTHLAEIFETTTATISTMLWRLKKLGYITIHDGKSGRSIRVVSGRPRRPKKSGESQCTLTPSQYLLRQEDAAYKGEKQDKEEDSSTPPEAVAVAGKAKKGKKEKPAPHPEVEPFTKLWFAAYEKKMGYAYAHAGWEDGSPLRKLCIATNLSAAQLMEIVNAAFDKSGKPFYWCENTRTIRGFCKHYNEIRNELTKHERNNPRNFGCAVPPPIHQQRLARIKARNESTAAASSGQPQRELPIEMAVDGDNPP